LTQAPRTGASRRWWIAVWLFLATVLNYLDRQVLSVTAPVLREQIGMNAVAYSRIVFCFLLAYAAMQAPCGKLVDRVGPKRGLTLVMIWWSVAGMLHSSARSALQFGFFRLLLGAGEAGNWPAAVKAVQRWFPPKERAFAVGLFNSGSAVGALVAPPLIVWLTLRFSWRCAFLVPGLLGLLWLVPWLAVYRDQGSEETDVAPGETRPRWSGLLRERRVWGLLLARFCCDPVWWFYVFWLPDYLSRGRGFTLSRIGYAASVPFFSAGLGSLVGGGLSGQLIRRGWQAVPARKGVMTASVVAMTAGVFAVRASSATVAIALISLITFAYSCWAANILTLPADLFEDNSIASVVGLSGSAAGVGGMLSTLAVGWAVEHLSYAPVFSVAAALPVLALASILILVPSSSRQLREGQLS